MDCLICCNVFDKKIEYKTEPPPKPEMCLKIICKLFNIPQNRADVREIFEDPLICRNCHWKVMMLDKILKSTEYEIRDVGTSKEAAEIEDRMSKSGKDQATISRAIESGGVVATLTIHTAQNDDSSEWTICFNLKRTICNDASDIGDRMSKSSRDRLTLFRAIETGGVVSVPGIDAQIVNIEDSTEDKFEQPLASQDPRVNGAVIQCIDEVAMEEEQAVEPLEIPVIGQANDSSGTNNTRERLEDLVYLKALLEEDAMEVEGAKPVQQPCSSQDVPANIFGPGPSRPSIVSRSGVDKEARICLKPLEITPGATGFKVRRVNQADESGSNYAFEIREKEPVNQESESSEEESSEEEKNEDEHLKCRFCSKILATKQNLKRHMAFHTGNLPYKCRHCSRKFIRKYLLKKHLGNKIPTKCVTCNKTLPTPGCLMQHEWKEHQRGHYARKENSSEKNFAKLKDGRFKCNRCDKIVIRPVDHLLIHRPPKFSCPVEGCGKMLVTSSKRTIHVKTYHKGECRVAGSGMSLRILRSKGSLLDHAKVHSKKQSQ